MGQTHERAHEAGPLLLPAAAERPDAARAEQLDDADLAELPSLGGRIRRTVGLSGRLANATSCARMISRAAHGDEANTTGTSPSLRYMSGASSRRARSAMARWTRLSPIRWCMLPITGSRHGPGGSYTPSPPFVSLSGSTARRNSGVKATRMPTQART